MWLKEPTTRKQHSAVNNMAWKPSKVMWVYCTIWYIFCFSTRSSQAWWLQQEDPTFVPLSVAPNVLRLCLWPGTLCGYLKILEHWASQFVVFSDKIDKSMLHGEIKAVSCLHIRLRKAAECGQRLGHGHLIRAIWRFLWKAAGHQEMKPVEKKCYVQFGLPISWTR